MKGLLPKIKPIGVLFIIVLIVALHFSEKARKRAISERDRYQNNQTALTEDLKRYKARDSLNAVSIAALTLTNKEFKEMYSEQSELIRDMGIKINRLESVSTAGTRTEYEIRTEVKDTVIYQDREVPAKIQKIEYRDMWLSLSGYIEDRIFAGKIASVDTIDQVVHRVPRRLLFIKYGTKGIQQEILSRNPHTNIEYARYIEFKRKK